MFRYGYNRQKPKDALGSPQKRREARRSARKPGEDRRDPESHREAQIVSESLKENKRSPEKARTCPKRLKKAQ